MNNGELTYEIIEKAIDELKTKSKKPLAAGSVIIEFNVLTHLIDVIDRQKADNKELQFRIDELQRKIVSYNSDILNEYKARIQVDEMVVCADSLGEWLDFIKKTEAEAIKECIEKFREIVPEIDDTYIESMVEEHIDNIYKEMEGDN